VGVLPGVETSKTNTHEAKYLLRLLQYLLLNGYRADQLVVLSMYKGQLQLLRRLAKQPEYRASSVIAVDALDKVRMTTTDNYQGEESDIVLGCLVRSNAGALPAT
jgi:superfamily I DNA and/or RNA helicase